MESVPDILELVLQKPTACLAVNCPRQESCTLKWDIELEPRVVVKPDPQCCAYYKPRKVRIPNTYRIRDAAGRFSSTKEAVILSLQLCLQLAIVEICHVCPDFQQLPLYSCKRLPGECFVQRWISIYNQSKQKGQRR